jgi:hypothetical protein
MASSMQATLAHTRVQAQQPHLTQGSLIPASSNRRYSAADTVDGTFAGSRRASLEHLDPPAAQDTLRHVHRSDALAAEKAQTRMAAAAARERERAAAEAHEALGTVSGPPPKVRPMCMHCG